MRETRIYISVTLEVKRFTERKNIALSIPPKCKLHATDVTRKGVAWITTPLIRQKNLHTKMQLGGGQVYRIYRFLFQQQRQHSGQYFSISLP